MRRLKLTTFFLVTVVWFLITLVSHSYADIPKTINYQGKLTDKQGYALTGTYNVTFRLYDAPTAGTLLWQEAHTGISVQRGLFSILLGTITPLNLPFDKQYYLSIQVGADPEMTPRQALASAPYAFRAASTEGAVASIFKKFGGDGSQGAVSISADTNFSTIDDSNRPGIAQFTNLAIDATKTLTVDTGFAYIGVQGTCTIRGSINANNQGYAGGEAVGLNTGGNKGTRGDEYRSQIATGNTDEILQTDSVPFCLSGSAGGGGYNGGCGGGAGGLGGAGRSGQGGTANSGGATSTAKMLRYSGGAGDNSTHGLSMLNIIYYRGAGGGGGGTGPSESYGPGGYGGGVIYIECDTLIFDGMLTANGQDGNRGGGTAGYGGGGGGGGGVILVRAKNIVTNTGTVSVVGGRGGVGTQGSGGAGTAGFKDIIQIQ